MAPSFPEVFDAIENAPKPVIAAIHGTALGGGFELTLVCHYRVASSDARIGLPEVNLGLLPGAGGTQRLPRVVGVEAALDIMTSGRMVKAKEALSLGLVDALYPADDLPEAARTFAKQVVSEGANRPRLRDRDAPANDPAVFAPPFARQTPDASAVSKRQTPSSRPSRQPSACLSKRAWPANRPSSANSKPARNRRPSATISSPSAKPAASPTSTPGPRRSTSAASA